jgi:hypothetical protein
MDSIYIKIPLKVWKVQTEETALEQFTSALQTLISIGAFVGSMDEILLGYEIHLDHDCVIAEMTKESFIDGAKLTHVGAGIVHSGIIMDARSDTSTRRLFSVSSIDEKLRTMNSSPRVQLKDIIDDYRRYYLARKERYVKNQNSLETLKNLFITDIIGLVNSISSELRDGKQLAVILGVDTIAPKLLGVAKYLSGVYSKAMSAEKESSTIPKDLCESLRESYSKFFAELCKEVFPGAQFKSKEPLAIEQQVHSYSDSGRIKYFSEERERVQK